MIGWLQKAWWCAVGRARTTCNGTPATPCVLDFREWCGIHCRCSLPVVVHGASWAGGPSGTVMASIQPVPVNNIGTHARHAHRRKRPDALQGRSNSWPSLPGTVPVGSWGDLVQKLNNQSVDNKTPGVRKLEAGLMFITIVWHPPAPHLHFSQPRLPCTLTRPSRRASTG